MKIHIPTEQYGFIEADVESVEEAKRLSDEIKSEFNDNKTGLDTKTWNKCIDRYLTEHSLNADDYAQMNGSQIAVIQEIKRSLNRITYKEEKANYEANRHQ
jgi:hypothetical protein